MKSKKQILFLVFKIVGVVVLLAIVFFFSFRNALLQKAIAKIDAKCQTEYECAFHVKKAKFQGLSQLELQEVSLVPQELDTLFYIKSLQTSVSIWQLFLGNIQVEKLKLEKGYLQLVKDKRGRNFDAFLKSKSSQKTNQSLDYAQLSYKILSKVLNLVPTDMKVNGFALRIDDMGNKVSFDFTKLELIQKQINALINVKTAGFFQEWKLSGFADPRDRKARLRFFNANHDTLKIPYLDQKFHLKTGFKAIHFQLDKLEMESGNLHINGLASIDHFFINHSKIAKKDVAIKNASFDYRFVLGARSIALDSTSCLQLNQIKCYPYLAYSNDDEKKYSLAIKIAQMKAQDFITSLPNGLFSHFNGMEVQGKFGYNLRFEYHEKKPNELVFESQLTPENLKILKYGQANLTKINHEFTYRAIEKGIPQRAVWVGVSNPYFTPLSKISPYLQKCVLTSEDPSFFNHRGFIVEAFKQSIAKNIRTKKFARGASTISMQLVKNVFLTREKTLSRKLEEILLVYILENNRIASKERMLEVYFNIIEWGPNVYGIGEASAYYFQKKPADLTLNECLFLATIIPKPKGFMYRFDGEKRLKPFATKQNQFLTRLLLRRGLISTTDTIGQSNPLILNGAAQFLLKQKPINPLPIDSLLINTSFDF